MAPHSSTLAWKIPWTEEPGRLQSREPGGLPSMGSHRVRHDWSDLAAAAAVLNTSSPRDLWDGCYCRTLLNDMFLSPVLCTWNCWGAALAKGFEVTYLVLWPPHAKSWFTAKDSNAGRDGGQEEKGTTEDEMAGWHHQLNGRGFGWTLEVSDGQGGLACCNSLGRKESDMTERLNWTDLVLALSGAPTRKALGPSTWQNFGISRNMFSLGFRCSGMTSYHGFHHTHILFIKGSQDNFSQKGLG